MTKEARPLTQEQRKEFVQLLKEAKTRVIDDLSNRHGERYRDAWRGAVTLLMDSLGASDAFERIMAARKDLKDAEKTLSVLGFRFDGDDDLELTSEGSRLHGEFLRDRQSKIMAGEVESARKTYENAILEVLATESVEEAKGFVRPLV